MIKEGKFGLFEGTCLLTVAIIAKLFFTSVRQLIKSAGTAAWYATLISVATSILLFLLVYLLMKRFPGKNLIEIFELVLGKVIGKLISTVFCAYFIFYSGSNIREFIEMIKAYNLPYTPPSFILTVFLIAVFVLAWIGIDGMARLSMLAFFPIVFGLLAILLLAMPFYQIDYVFPIGGFGLDRTIYTGLLRGSAYDEAVILAFFMQSLHGTRHLKKAGIYSLILSGLLVSICVFCDLAAFAYEQGGDNLSLLFQLARLIYFSRFFQRVEAIFLIIWIIAAVICVGLAFYTAVSIYCKTFHIGNHRPLLLPFIFLTYMVALLPESLMQNTTTNIMFLRQYSMFFLYFVPILVLLISLILRKKGKKPDAEKA